MVKTLEIPDIHFDPRWADVTADVIKHVCDAAVEHGVDFISMPGDLFDHPLYATEKGGLNVLRQFVKDMLKICPVVAVEGTPSHDGPGCYGSLEDLGLVLLSPGKVYGYFRGEHVKGQERYNVREIRGDGKQPDAILFGVPELNTQNIQAVLSRPADEANAEAIVQFRRYVAEFMGPRRMQYADAPAFGLFHGNVSDAKRENEIDVILKASDILIHTEDMTMAALNRWSLGHIHNPWESSTISAGYAGFSGISSNPWGNRNFVPSMNLVTVENATALATVERIPYGTPERRKIAQPVQVVDPNIAYWLHTGDPDARLQENVHPWSRITIAEQRQETRRITKEDAAKIRTLRDMFQLADPEVTESALGKVDTIEEAVPVIMGPAVDVSVDSVRVQGCILFNGAVLDFDKTALSPGVTALLGANGSGKSSALAFMTPYPVIVGKHALSGRTSAIKDFFDSPESLIEKRLTVNGEPHKHVITVRGAHTQSPKVECSLDINGVPQLERGSFDEMMTLCESLYGPFTDYLLTTFYVQPLQGKTGSSLMSATMTDIRDLVQSIGGIDREQEKQFALDKVQECGDTITAKTAWINTAGEFLVDVSVLTAEIAGLELERGQKAEELAVIETRGHALKAQVEADRAAKEAKDNLVTENEAREKLLYRASVHVITLKAAIQAAEASREGISTSTAIIVQHEEASASLARLQGDYNKALTSNQELQAEYQTLYEQAVKLDSTKKQAGTVIHALTEAAGAVYHDTCPNCHVALPWAEAEIATRKAKAERRALLVTAHEAMLDPEWPTKPGDFEFDSTAIDKLKNEIAELDIDTAKRTVKDGAEAEGVIKSANEQIVTLNVDIVALTEGIQNTKALIVDDDLGEVLREAEAAQESARTEYTDCKSAISGVDSRLEQKTAAIASAKESAAKIETEKRALELLNVDMADWGYIARMLRPAKIPAIELELVLDSIDAEATGVIEPFHEGRFSFTTETQRQGKVGAVDKFDIRIHDGEAGREKSFLQYSPGVKAFFNDAYIKALVRQRNERSRRAYSPVIMDEADGPIQPERVAAFYEMQDLYWTNATVLVVSHNSASHSHIPNTITTEDILS